MHRSKVLQNNVKRQISVIQQGNVIFHGTIREDIFYHQPEFGYHHLEWGIEGEGARDPKNNKSTARLSSITIQSKRFEAQRAYSY